MSSNTAPSILCVDDDTPNRRALTTFLQLSGFRTREAATGRDALLEATKETERPDLVILDVNLPDVDGFEVRRCLRADPATAAIPILHLSGVFVASQDRIRALEGGADGYLTKPADPEEIIATVRALLRTHQAEEASRAAAHEWQATFDSIPDVILLLDAEGAVVRCNRAAVALLGPRAKEASGRLCRDLLREVFGLEGENLLDAAAGAGSTTPEVNMGGRWFRVSANPAGLRGAGGQVLLLTDVTDRRTLEERLRHGDKLEAVGRLAGGVAHEFNNLLTGVIANLSLALHATTEDDPRCAWLRTAEATAWRAAALTRQLLGFARRTEFRPKQIDLRECIGEAASLLRPALGPAVRLEVVPGDGLGMVLADPAGMVQILMNLCLNARDAIPEGGTIFVETSEAPSEVGRDGAFIRLRVRDTGPGVAPEAERHLFEPFFTTKEVGKGTGLGLAVVYGIVREHGGWIVCHSAAGQGACFDVYLPKLGEIDSDRTP